MAIYTYAWQGVCIDRLKSALCAPVRARVTLDAPDPTPTLVLGDGGVDFTPEVMKHIWAAFNGTIEERKSFEAEE